MGQRPAVQTRVRTKLAAERVKRGVSRQRLADAVGISPATLRRYENDPQANPPVRVLVNLAIALDTGVEDSSTAGSTGPNYAATQPSPQGRESSEAAGRTPAMSSHVGTRGSRDRRADRSNRLRRYAQARPPLADIALRH